MMMAPYSYVAGLKGKTREEALNEIKELRKEIKRLRAAIEEEVCSAEWRHSPSPDVRISVYYDYIDAAKKYFKEQGWEYEPSREEIRDTEFNERLELIKSIDIAISAPTSLRGSVARRFMFNGEEVEVRPFFSLKPPVIEDVSLKIIEERTKSEIIDELREIHMGRWKRNYMNVHVLDGEEWSVEVRYTDGKKKKFDGCNGYPYNFDSFLEVMGIDWYGVPVDGAE